MSRRMSPLGQTAVGRVLLFLRAWPAGEPLPTNRRIGEILGLDATRPVDLVLTSLQNLDRAGRIELRLGGRCGITRHHKAIKMPDGKVLTTANCPLPTLLRVAGPWRVVDKRVKVAQS